jgi:uncharacterized membrane protein YvlD (DUF360 family)
MTIGRLLLLLAAVTILCAYFGWLPLVDQSARALLQPTRTRVAPASMERDEAMLLFFFCMFLAPFAVAAAVLTAAFVLAMLSGSIRPAVRWLSLPSYIAPTLAVLVFATTLIVVRHRWLPTTRWMFDVVIRAYQVAFT